MHLVFASSLVRSGPPESGYEIANHAIIEGLRRVGATVTEIGFKWSGSELTHSESTICLGDVDLKTDGASASQKLKWLAKAVIGNTTFASGKLRIIDGKALTAAIADAETRNGTIDGVIVNGVTLAGAFENILTKRPYVFVAHNVEHVSATQNADDAAGPIETWMYRREARHLKKLESRLCKKAEFVLTLADEDRDALGIASDDKSATLTLVTPSPEKYLQSGRIKAFDIGMIGSWTWTPNRIGLEWFLRDVVPLLPENVDVAIAGKAPQGMRARDPRVKLLGRVNDAKDFIRQCRVVALTSRVGTGVQLKTIEAFEMGLPCVATKSSLRGISHIPDNARVADTPKAFAKAIAELVADVRSGAVDTVDGRAFREYQMREMDGVLTHVLSRLQKR